MNHTTSSRLSADGTRPGRTCAVSVISNSSAAQVLPGQPRACGPGPRAARWRGAEPAAQLTPGRRGEKHQPGTGHGLPDLPRAGHVDLEQARHTALELLGERHAQRAAPMADEPRPTPAALCWPPAGGRQPVKLPVVDKVIFAPAYFGGPRLPCRDRRGNPDLGTRLAEFGGDRALPDPGGPGEHGQPRMHRGCEGATARARRGWLPPVTRFRYRHRTLAQARPAGWCPARVRDAIPLCPAFP
jgi:hypothetical protein